MLAINCIFAGNKTLQDMSTTNYDFQFPTDVRILLPTFTSSLSIAAQKLPPAWVKAKDAAAYLAQRGVSVTTQTLFNMEKRGELTTLRISQRNIQFDLNEVKERFKVA